MAVTGVWDARTGEPLLLRPPLSDPVKRVVLTPDGSGACFISDTRAVVGDVKSGAWKTPIAHGLVVPREASLSADASRLVLSNASTATTIDCATGRRLASVQHRGDILDVAFAPDGESFGTAAADNRARVWDAKTGKPLGPELRHKGHVASVAFHPNGRWLLTAGQDLKARLWDALTGDALGEILSPGGAIHNAWFDNAGASIVLNTGVFSRVPLPAFDLPRDDVATYLTLMTGQTIDATDGLTAIRRDTFIRQLADYERVWFLSRNQQPPPRPKPKSSTVSDSEDSPTRITVNMAGKTATVTMQVVATRNIGRICFLNYDKNFSGKFCVVIHQSAYPQFPEPPEQLFLDRRVRVTGLVTIYRDVPQIEVKDAKQIEIVE
jgi:hypothetical protein